mmetsp:Transcript_119848/g.187989  ORF Transcript_119848/g.187989 Transcript_119848/m.187989 type:complete len:159 (+) Transcript_119848:80-556(+)
MNESANDAAEPQTLCAMGQDLQGRPTLVARPSVHVAHTEEDSLRAVSQCMEVVRNTFQQLPDKETKLLVLYDLHGAGMKNFDITFTKHLIAGLSASYPNRLEKVVVFNNHWSFNIMWRAISMFLHPETLQKVTFHGRDYRDKLLAYVDASHPCMHQVE